MLKASGVVAPRHPLQAGRRDRRAGRWADLVLLDGWAVRSTRLGGVLMVEDGQPTEALEEALGHGTELNKPRGSQEQWLSRP